MPVPVPPDVGQRQPETGLVVTIEGACGENADHATRLAVNHQSTIQHTGISAEVLATGSPRKRFDKAVKQNPRAILALSPEGNSTAHRLKIDGADEVSSGMDLIKGLGGALVRERFHEIATLRAMGVAGRRLQLAIVVEGLALTGLGCLLGLPLGAWMATYLDRILLAFPGVPARVSFFVFQPGPSAAALLALLAAGALAGTIPGRMALRMPLGAALREEAD